MKAFRLISGKVVGVIEKMNQSIVEGWELDNFGFSSRYSKY